MDATYTLVTLLPPAISLIMFGLGLTLTFEDFARVIRYPRAVIVGLLVQTILLVAVAFAITRLFELPPMLAVGLMLLAASPGGAMANVFSHLANGDVALNITLTAINSLLALAWLPLVMNLALVYFLGAGQFVPPPTQKVVEVVMYIVLPVLFGMLMRHFWVALAQRAEKPVRIASVLLLGCVVLLSIAAARDTLARDFAAVGLACVFFNLISMALGYAVPRLAGLPVRQSISISFEIGVHNAAVAIFVAMKILQDQTAAVPAALYGLVMITTGSLACVWLRHRHARSSAATVRV